MVLRSEPPPPCRPAPAPGGDGVERAGDDSPTLRLFVGVAVLGLVVWGLALVGLGTVLGWVR